MKRASREVDAAIRAGAIPWIARADVPDGLIPFLTLLVILGGVMAPVVVRMV